MAEYDDVCALVPTRDEAETIGAVVDALREVGIGRILVVDGHSTDETRAVAREHGADVIVQSGEGKGQAVREGVRHADRPYILMLDGDGTNPPEQAERLLGPLLAGEADHVIGDRTADMEPGAMSLLNRVGNRLINGAFRVIHTRGRRGSTYGDILSGYRAFTRESFEKSHLTAEGFGIETELSVECARHNFRVIVVPTTYRARPEGSETNLHPLRDGANIILTLYGLAKTSNPLFYFGSVGAVSAIVGVIIALFVGYDWFVYRTSHDVLAIVAAAALLLGVQLAMFGVLSDLVVRLHRETLRRIEESSDTGPGGDMSPGDE